MWWALALLSAVLLGVYDVAKKKSLRKNSVMWVLFSVSAISTLMLSPFFHLSSPHDTLILLPKAALVTASWISGLEGMKRLPLTIASTIKASRPVFVVVLSIIIFGERLNPMQWVGVVVALSALFMLSRSSAREGIVFTRNAGILWMGIAVVTGVSSALYDKYVMGWMDPVFVLCWSNLFIAIFMGIILIVKVMTSPGPQLGERSGEVSERRFTPDWWLLLTAVLIVGADALYFKSLAAEGAMLSVVSLLRRGCVIVTFCVSAIVFKEHNIKNKAIDLAVLLCGMVILAMAS